MAIVTFILYVTNPWYSLSKYPWPWHWPFEWAKVKYKYTSLKPMNDFSFNINSTSVIVCEIIIYELSKYCQLQHLTLKPKFKVKRNNVADCTLDLKFCPCKLVKNGCSTSNLFLWSTKELYRSTFYRLPVLKIGKFWMFTFKISMKVTNLNDKITNAHNDYKTEKISRCLPQSDVRCDLKPWQKRSKTKQKHKKW